MIRVTLDPANGRSARPEMVEAKSVADPPSNKVIGARSVAAHTDATHLLATGSQQHKPATKYVHPRLHADRGIARGPIEKGIPLIRDPGSTGMPCCRPYRVPPGCTAENRLAVDSARPCAATLGRPKPPLTRRSLRAQRSNLVPIRAPQPEIASSPSAPRNDPGPHLVGIRSNPGGKQMTLVTPACVPSAAANARSWLLSPVPANLREAIAGAARRGR
jgi:hypothetical protein